MDFRVHIRLLSIFQHLEGVIRVYRARNIYAYQAEDLDKVSGD